MTDNKKRLEEVQNKARERADKLASSGPKDRSSRNKHSDDHEDRCFISYLQKCRPLIENYLLTHAPHAATGKQQNDLERYLYGPLARFNARGGKRIRPALCLLGCEAVGGELSSALPLACAIENFQSAALIHDDIADESLMRRGEPCVYRLEGVGLAINIGDLALIEVMNDICVNSGLSDSVMLRVIREIMYMERMTLEGQALDLGWARDERWDVTPADYLYMAQHKTAFYSGAVPLAVGAICGGGIETQIEALRAFGYEAGLGFQLADDLLNLVGDADAQGKDFRNDITEGKRTLAVVWALEHLDAERAQELVSILSAHTSDPALLSRAVQLMSEANAIEHVRTEARRLAMLAKSRLAGVALADGAYETLLSVADFFIERSA